MSPHCVHPPGKDLLNQVMRTNLYPLQLPESLRKFLSNLSNKKNNADLLTHCKHELMHAIWRQLLDDDFVEAYKHGIVVECFDGITRQVYPRIFTYSADYPEK